MATNLKDKVAIVTGAHKGLGFAVVKALCRLFPGVVYLTSRNETKGLQAVQKLKEMGSKAKFFHLDVSDKKSVQKFSVYIKNNHGGFDILVNCASIIEWDQVYPTYEVAKRNIDVNYYSLLSIECFLYPLLRDGARVVNVTNECGLPSNLKKEKWLDLLLGPKLSEEDIDSFVDEYLDSVKNGTFDKDDFIDDGKHAEYRVSNIAITALTMVQQAKYVDRNVSINAINPGYLRGDMPQGKGKVNADDAAFVVMYLLFNSSPKLRGTVMWPNQKLIDWYDPENDYGCTGVW